MATGPINLNGDHLVSTTGRHGADIAGQRLDDLDRRALRTVLESSGRRPVCIDYGSGLGWQGTRFALLGAEAWLVDQLPVPPLVRKLQPVEGIALHYLQRDLARLEPTEMPPQIDLAFSQRTVHYLRRAQAQALLAATASRMARGACFFLSASGLDSELGQGYGAFDAPVGERWAFLSPAMQARHEIAEPVCLYRPAELSALMEDAGFDAIEVWTSAFGNVKGVFARR